MKAILELDDEMIRGLRITHELRALEGDSVLTDTEQLMEFLRFGMKSYTDDAVLDDAGCVIASSPELSQVAHEVALMGGDWKATHDALVEAAKLAARN
ncbi:MAG: hypothetical protein ACOYMN_13395 [Roseimicrobium sp.]